MLSLIMVLVVTVLSVGLACSGAIVVCDSLMRTAPIRPRHATVRAAQGHLHHALRLARAHGANHH